MYHSFLWPFCPQFCQQWSSSREENVSPNFSKIIDYSALSVFPPCGVLGSDQYILTDPPIVPHHCILTPQTHVYLISENPWISKIYEICVCVFNAFLFPGQVEAKVSGPRSCHPNCAASRTDWLTKPLLANILWLAQIGKCDIRYMDRFKISHNF